MKIRVEVECTPEEARRFMGFPDVSELNDQILDATRKMMTEGSMAMLTPDAMLKFWAPFGVKTIEDFQNLMRGSLATGKTTGKN